MRVLRYWRLGLGAAVALSVSLALAADPVSYPECDRKPTPAEQEGAKGAHKAASQFYDRGDYDKAIGYWGDAYRFDCTAHGVLLNIGNAYEKKGDKQAAISTFETYLKRSGPDPTIEDKVKNLKASLLPAPPSTGSAVVPPSATGSAVAPPPSASASAVPTAPPLPTALRPYGPAPWVVVGGGAAAVVAGAILMPVGLGAISMAEKVCPPPARKCPAGQSQYIDSGNAGRLQAGVGIALLAAGGVAVAGGLVWQIAFNKPLAGAPAKPRDAAPAAIRVSPVLGPGHTGLSVSGAF